jgi:hypothetical protein
MRKETHRRLATAMASAAAPPPPPPRTKGPTSVQKAGGAPSGTLQTYVANVNRIWHSVAGCS